MTASSLRTVSLCLAILSLTACDPKDRRPGLWLSGNVETAPVSDWSFVDAHREIFVETRTWYGIPHSVTTVVVAHNGTLYVPSVYFEGGEFPNARFWNRNVVRDPRVRLKIGDRIFERRAVLVEDPAEWNRVLAAFAQKMPFWKELAEKPESERPTIVFLRMDPRADAV
jgi:F420H(2)-dependent quinone reductase